MLNQFTRRGAEVYPRQKHYSDDPSPTAVSPDRTQRIPAGKRAHDLAALVIAWLRPLFLLLDLLNIRAARGKSNGGSEFDSFERSLLVVLSLGHQLGGVAEGVHPIPEAQLDCGRLRLREHVAPTADLARAIGVMVMPLSHGIDEITGTGPHCRG